MKKFLAFILALACALSLMACGKKNNDDKPDPDPAPDPQPAVTTAEFTHGYVDMALDLPEGWSWAQVYPSLQRAGRGRHGRVHGRGHPLLQDR